MSTKNPAGRFVALLNRGDQIQNSLAIKDAWKEILCEGEDDACLMRRLGFVYSLPGAISEAVMSLKDENADLLLREMHKVQAALDRPLTEAWQNFLVTIDDAARYSLEVISDRLDRSSREPEVPPDQLAALLEAVRALLKDALAADLSPPLRLLMVRHLQAMARAIEEVQLRGVDALREAVEGAIGGAVIYMQTAGGPPSNKEKSWWEKLIRVAAGALVILNVGTGTIELGQQVYKALPMSDPTETEIETGETGGTLPK